MGTNILYSMMLVSGKEAFSRTLCPRLSSQSVLLNLSTAHGEVTSRLPHYTCTMTSTKHILNIIDVETLLYVTRIFILDANRCYRSQKGREVNFEDTWEE